MKKIALIIFCLILGFIAGLYFKKVSTQTGDERSLERMNDSLTAINSVLIDQAKQNSLKIDSLEGISEKLADTRQRTKIVYLEKRPTLPDTAKCSDSLDLCLYDLEFYKADVLKCDSLLTLEIQKTDIFKDSEIAYKDIIQNLNRIVSNKDTIIVTLKDQNAILRKQKRYWKASCIAAGAGLVLTFVFH